MSPVKRAPRKAVPRKAAAKATAKVDAPAATAAGAVPYASLYPKGAELFVFTSDSGVVITFPKYSSVPPPDRAMWRKLYNLPDMIQPFEWMNYAGVPEAMQALTDGFTDKEYEALFNEWFADSALTSGE